MDLFDLARENQLAQKAPLAARMRPRSLEEYVGQGHILGPGRLLRRAIQADQLSSLLFYGPPGVGKTTLARIIANTTKAHFAAINAVLAGVADIRREVGEARDRLAQHGARTILFVDEVHRFNKSQQDALLPHVENGTVVLVGATTENPYFEVNKTILSRSRVFELRPLEEADLKAVVAQALADPERGYGRRKVELAPEALDHLAHVANGDARAVLNALELAVETTPPQPDGTVRVGLEEAEESIQRKAVLYDKDGDAHFDIVSAFIKSLRGSDPDAALYWMARMVYGGEDPRFILRRMVIFASEDVGLADPQALQVVLSAAQSYDYVGMPEGRFPLAQACLYLALAPKSNSLFAFFDALASVEKERAGEVPNHLKDASRDSAGFGHGQGYQYPHAYRDHWVAQQYLPDVLQGRLFYQPGELGAEEAMAQRVALLREAQLAAGLEGSAALLGPLEGLTGPEAHSGGAKTGAARREEEFLRRGEGALGHHLNVVRQTVFQLAQLSRHHLVLDANAASGLLTWEAQRQAFEGGVWALAATGQEAAGLARQAAGRDALSRPVVLQGTLEELPRLLQAQGGAGPFDRILARGLLGGRAGKPAAIALLAGLLAPGGRLVVAEPAPRLGGRLLNRLPQPPFTPQAAQAAAQAEEALYADPDDPAVNWDDEDLARWLEEAGLKVSGRRQLSRQSSLPLSRALLERWFGQPGPDDPRRGRLAQKLGPQAQAVKSGLEGWLNRPLDYTGVVVVMAADKPA